MLIIWVAILELYFMFILYTPGQAYRYCESKNSWHTIDASGCYSARLRRLLERLLELKNTFITSGVGPNLTLETYLAEVQNVSEETTNIISILLDLGSILPNDLSTTNSILDAIIWLVFM